MILSRVNRPKREEAQVDPLQVSQGQGSGQVRDPFLCAPCP